MDRFRAWWVLGLVLVVSGCAGGNRRPGWSAPPPMLGRAEPSGAREVQEPAVARGEPSLGEGAAVAHREPRIFSRFFPSLFRRGIPTASPPEPSLSEGSRPLAATSAPPAARRAREVTAPDRGAAPVLSVAIDLPAPPEQEEAPTETASERLASLETAQEDITERLSAAPGAEDADESLPPPLVEATRPRDEPANGASIVTDPDSDPVLAGRPRMRRLPPPRTSALPADLPAATFPRSYYDADAPPAATRASAPESNDQPRRLRWPIRFLARRTPDAPVAHFP